MLWSWKQRYAARWSAACSSTGWRGFVTTHHPAKAAGSDLHFETCSGGEFSRACSGSQKSSPLLQEAFPLHSLAFRSGRARVFAPVALEKPQHICRMGYPIHRHLVQIPKSLTMFGLSNSAMRAASLWKSACMSADASSFSIFTATMVKGSYGSSPGALRERKTQVKGASTPNAGSVSGVKWWRQKQGGSIQHWPKDWSHQEWKIKIFYMKMLKEPPFPHAAQWWHWHIWLLSENK